MSIRNRTHLIQRLNNLYFDLQEVALGCAQFGTEKLAKRLNQIAVELGEMPAAVQVLRGKRASAKHDHGGLAESEPAETNERLYTEADLNAIMAARDAVRAQKTTSLSLYRCHNCDRTFATAYVRDHHEEGCQIKQLSSSEETSR